MSLLKESPETRSVGFLRCTSRDHLLRRGSAPVFISCAYFSLLPLHFPLRPLLHSEYMVGTAHKLTVRPASIVGDMGCNLPVDARLRSKHRSAVVSAARRAKAEKEAERGELEALSNTAKKSRTQVRMTTKFFRVPFIACNLATLRVHIYTALTSAYSPLNHPAQLTMNDTGSKSNMPDLSAPALKRSERSRAPRIHMYDFFVH